jgi:glycopeptide antibiotics resistance protein
MGYNLLFFVPFGLLLSVNLKRATFRRKVAHVFFFSLALEAIQCIFAIGIADVTDVIMNTAGGLLGLALYGISRRYVDGKKLNKWTTITIGAVVVLLFAFVYSVQLAHNKHRPQLTAKAAFAHSPFSSRTTHKQEK